MLILIIISIYSGAVIIIFTNNNIIGIVFTSVAIVIGFIAIGIYVKRNFLKNI